MKKDIYIKLEEFCTSFHSIAYNTYLDNKEEYFAEFKLIVNHSDFNINEIIEDYKNQYRYITPLFYILTTSNNDFLKIVMNSYKDKIIPDYRVENIEYNLLQVMYESLKHYGTSTDIVVPLIFHFEDLYFLEIMTDLKQKRKILLYLIENSTKYSANEHLKFKLKTMFEDTKRKSEKEVISDLIFKISFLENDLELLTEHSEHKKISKKINKLKSYLMNI